MIREEVRPGFNAPAFMFMEMAIIISTLALLVMAVEFIGIFYDPMRRNEHILAVIVLWALIMLTTIMCLWEVI